MPNPILQVQNISIRLGFKQILTDISFQAKKGEVWGIIGPNGSGKTTLFRIILGFLTPDSGKVELLGSEDPELYRRKMGITLDDSAFDQYMTGLNNLKVVAALRNIDFHTEIAPWINAFDLEDGMHKRVKNYSYGMKKRLGLIAAFSANTEMLLLDEPANGLDVLGQMELGRQINAYSARGGTVLLSSHTLTDVEKTCTHILLLHKGNALAAGTLEEVSKGFNNLEEAFLSKVNAI